MKVDIVFPNNNEEKLIETAEKLDWNGLCFAYRFQQNISLLEEKTEKLRQKTKLKLFIGAAADSKDIQKAKNIFDLVIIKSTENDQQILEKSNPDLIFGMELTAKRDYSHFRQSGLNQVLCRLANKKNIIFAMPLSIILKSEDKPKILGRIMQNITLCRKFKANLAFCSFAENPYEMKSSNDLMSLAIALGMEYHEAKDALGFFGEKILSNKKKKSSEYLGEGIELSEQ